MPSLRSTAIFLGTWLTAFSWRPFFLGFYSDDYMIILEPISEGRSAQQLYEFYTRLYANRPLSGLFMVGLVELCGNSPFAWQVVASLLCLLTGLLVWMVATRLNLIGTPMGEERIAWLSSLWFILPTSLGFSSWPTYVAHLPAAIFFLACFHLLLPRAGQASPYDIPLWRGIAALAAYCCCVARPVTQLDAC